MARHTCLDGPSLIPMLLEIAVLEGRRVLRQRRRRKNPAPPVSTSVWTAPDSDLCRAAAETCALHSTPGLVGHCGRTYAFGMALSSVLGKRPDRELLYVAAQLHDLGLTPEFDGDGPFELRGANAAYDWCREHDVPEAAAELVHEAIRLHTSLVAARSEPEIALVHFGAGADVIGYHLEDIAPDTVAAILELWPRKSFKQEVHALLGEQARRNPDSPAGAQWRLGFGKRILDAPFES